MTTTTLRSRLEKEFESYCDNYLKANHFNPNDKEIADWWLDKLESEIEGREKEWEDAVSERLNRLWRNGHGGSAAYDELRSLLTSKDN